MRVVFLLSLILVAVCGGRATIPAGAMEPEELIYLTENYYPYNYVQDGKVVGISPDIIREMWKVMGAREQEFHLYPWARAYHTAQNAPNTVLFGMARTGEREHLFKWVGPITVNRFVLFKRKDADNGPFTAKDLKGATVGTVRNDVSDQILATMKTGARIQPVCTVDINLRKILDKRIDFLAHEEACMRMLLKKQLLNEDTLAPVLTLREVPIYIAVSTGVPDELVKRLNSALAQVRNSPVYDEIFEKYMH